MADLNYANLSSMRGKILAAGRIAVPANVFTVPANSGAMIKTFTVTNADAGTTTRLFNARLIPSGGSDSDDAYWIVRLFPIAPGDTVSFTEIFAGMMLGEGDHIRLSADIDTSVLNFHITGQISA